MRASRGARGCNDRPSATERSDRTGRGPAQPGDTDGAAATGRGDRIARRLTLAYAIALLLVAGLAGGLHYFLGQAIAQQTDIGTVINVAGRQRMLSQRIALSAEAREVAEALQEAVAEARGPGLPPLTVSIGAALLDRALHHGLADLLRRADQGLYAAKDNGRNRVEFITAGTVIATAADRMS